MWENARFFPVSLFNNTANQLSLQRSSRFNLYNLRFTIKYLDHLKISLLHTTVAVLRICPSGLTFNYLATDEQKYNINQQNGTRKHFTNPRFIKGANTTHRHPPKGTGYTTIGNHVPQSAESLQIFLQQHSRWFQWLTHLQPERRN